MSDEILEVHGSLIQGYAQACINLNIIAGKVAIDTFSGINMNDWYPLSKWTELERIVISSYKNSGPIMQRVGIEMMRGWYNYGPGKGLIKAGVDFLHFQTGSKGYVSVVKGSKEQVGKFELKLIVKEDGKAIVESTTPFNKNMEQGVLIGGMLAPGDLDYVDARISEDNTHIEIEFH